MHTLFTLFFGDKSWLTLAAIAVLVVGLDAQSITPNDVVVDTLPQYSAITANTIGLALLARTSVQSGPVSDMVLVPFGVGISFENRWKMVLFQWESSVNFGRFKNDIHFRNIFRNRVWNKDDRAYATTILLNLGFKTLEFNRWSAYGIAGFGYNAFLPDFSSNTSLGFFQARLGGIIDLKSKKAAGAKMTDFGKRKYYSWRLGFGFDSLLAKESEKRFRGTSFYLSVGVVGFMQIVKTRGYFD